MALPPEKSDEAFRTIREVADWLRVPTHVLRFWESKFEMISPVKGAGGRRYYRPEDMRLLGGIKVLLHDQGLTIRGVSQRIEAEGVEPVMALSPALLAVEASDGPPAGGGAGAPDRVVAFPPRTGGGAEDRAGGQMPDADEDEVLDGASQPEDDPMPEQPVGTPSPPQPDDGGLHEPQMPPQPADDKASRAARAPAEPDDDGGERDGDAPSDRRGEGGGGGVSEPTPSDRPAAPRTPAPRDGDATPAPGGPASERPTGLAPGRRRRLRRIAQRLRGLIADLEEDLARGQDR